MEEGWARDKQGRERQKNKLFLQFRLQKNIMSVTQVDSLRANQIVDISAETLGH
jgi:hypothetical protein